MGDPLDLDDLEERTFRSRLEDGTADIVLGLFVALMGTGMALSEGTLMVIVAPMLLFLWQPVHAAIVEPRLGYVEYADARKAAVRRKMGLMTVAMSASVLVGAAFWLAHTPQAPRVLVWLKGLGPLGFSGSLAALVVVGAALLRLARAYVYGAVILAGGLLGHLLAEPRGMGLGLVGAGLFILVFGVVLLARFLARHPVLEQGGRHGSP